MTATVDIHGYALPAGLARVWQDAVSSAGIGDFSAAAGCMQRILEAQPDFVPAMVQAAYFLLAQDRYREARRLALDAATNPARSPEAAFEIARLLRLFEEIETVDSVVRHQDWSTCRSARLLVELAAQVAPLGLYDATTHLLDHAERLEPGTPAVATLRGTVSAVRGDKPAAGQWYRRALEASAGTLPQVHWLQSLSSSPDPAAAIREIHAARRQVMPGGEGEAYLDFALHNVCHAAGEFGESWDALQRGCRTKRRLESYDAEAQRAVFDLLHGTGPEKAAGVSAAAAGGRPQDPDPGLVFIVGMHRSGTTLLERMLAGHPDIRDGGETNVFPASLRLAADHYAPGVLDAGIVRRLGRADLGEAGGAFRRYARWRAAGRGWLTEKLPSNFLNVGFILRALPEARILHMRRDPIDTCFSNLRTYFSGAAAYSYDQGELADFYLRYRRLMDHWHDRAPGRILDVDYELLVQAPEPQARRIAAFCGFGYVDGMLQVDRAGGSVATASIGSVRAGILKDRGGAWKPYAAQLQPMLDALSTID
ncbi:sulfotransferase [Luteimonas vadosa]|uniref:Tetratricopeptide repeat protein n=1 Tax=Luteimonas vadosa TaxID=1165507 RepID=A0ABP9DUK3_9GAMM